MGIKEELELIPKNAPVWINTVKATEFNIKLLLVIIAVEWVMDWYQPTFVNQMVALQVSATGNSSPTGLISLPFWLYRLALFVFPLFAFSVWRSIWADHFNFPKVNWYYYADFYVSCFFTLHFALMAVVWINGLESLGHSLNEMGSSLLKLDETVFRIVFIVFLIQLASIPSTVYGLKYWFIGLGIAVKLSLLLGLPDMLQRIPAWGFFAVSILLLVRVLKDLQQKAGAGSSSPA